MVIIKDKLNEGQTLNYSSKTLELLTAIGAPLEVGKTVNSHIKTIQVVIGTNNAVASTGSVLLKGIKTIQNNGYSLKFCGSESEFHLCFSTLTKWEIDPRRIHCFSKIGEYITLDS